MVHTVITVGEQIVAAMYRKSSGGFKTNVALGADTESCKITKEMEDLAAKSSVAVGGGILGIDMMKNSMKQLVPSKNALQNQASIKTP